MITLSKRLQTIASRIPECDALCDVGCDHGYLPIWAVSEGVCDHAYALDVRKGPLDRAKKNVEEAGLLDRITLRLSDGLEKMSPGEAQVIIISGMGGPLVEGILTRGAAVAQKAQSLVLSPQSHLYEFRIFLSEQGYHITDETPVFDDGKHYYVMTVEYREGEHMVLDEFQLRYGTCDPALIKDFLALEKKRLLSIRENLIKNSPKDQRLFEIEKELTVIDGRDI